ncbi:MAG: cytochrome c, class I [Arcobacter sp.]|nr:MAG: cytochrome c, class I [Arcobacter sp.]
MKNILKLSAIAALLATGLQADVFETEHAKGDSTNGAQVWADVCMRCHNQREPAALSKRAWKYSMQHMRVRAGLTGQETRDILAFILESKTIEDAK